MDDLNSRAPLLYYVKLCAPFDWLILLFTRVEGTQKSNAYLAGTLYISNPSVNSNWSNNPKMLNSGQNWRFFCPCDLEIWQMTLKPDRAPLLYNVKLCASFQSHQWIQTGVTVWKRSIWDKICNFLSCVTLKSDGWPWKTTGYIFYAASNFVHHFIAISEFKLELQSGNAHPGSKSMIFFLSCVTLKYDS